MKAKLLKISILFVALTFFDIDLWAQQSLHVFFAGNSYTSVNDLPGMVAHIAQSMGDEMTYASNTMEQSFDDACVALVAKKLGKTEDYERFYRRSMFYMCLL